MKWIKDNILIIALIIIFGFLAWSAITNYFLDKRFDNYKIEKGKLEVLYNQLQENYSKLDLQFSDSQAEILVLQARVDSLKHSYALKTAEIARKEKEYLTIIHNLRNIPADTVYKRLFVFYPPDSELKYPFAANQVRSFYQTHIELEYSEGLVFNLNDQINNLNFDLSAKSSIIINKNVQIKVLSSRIKLGDNYTDNLGQINKDIERSYKSERLQKRIWQGVSIIELGYIILKNN